MDRESNSQGSDCLRVFGAQGSFVASECKGTGVGQEQRTGANPIRNGPVLAGSTSNAFEAKRVTGPARLRREWNSIRANSKNLGREARIGPSLLKVEVEEEQETKAEIVAQGKQGIKMVSFFVFSSVLHAQKNS